MRPPSRIVSTDPRTLVREDLRDFTGYVSARGTTAAGNAWLNANESPWTNGSPGTERLRRYPDPQPHALRESLAKLYGAKVDQLLVGRGSDEAIDLLLRALCRPGGDAVLTCPPTFGMYAVCARLHGTRVVEVPLQDLPAEGFACDFARVGDVALEEGVRLVFLCSPGNPTGNLLPLDAIEALATRLDGQAIVVVDEAYGEFAEAESAVSLLTGRRNIAVLRTLSKAHALAGARIGSVIADASLIEVLRRCQAPYPVPEPCVAVARQAVAPAVLVDTRVKVGRVVAERARLRARLEASPGVVRVYPSWANFLLVRFSDAEAAYRRLLDAGIVVRDQRTAPGLGDALRITIGTPEQNDRVINAVVGMEQPA